MIYPLLFLVRFGELNISLVTFLSLIIMTAFTFLGVIISSLKLIKSTTEK